MRSSSIRMSPKSNDIDLVSNSVLVRDRKGAHRQTEGRRPHEDPRADEAETGFVLL